MRDSQPRTPPAYLNLEPTNRCNLSCRWCVASSVRPRGLLDEGVATSILDQASRAGVRQIRFFLAGEPLLHPQIGHLVAEATSRGLHSVLHTNAMLLTSEMGEALLEAGLKEISFSINGVDEKVVREVQLGADLRVMADNVRRFVALRGSGRLPRTILQVIQPGTELATALPAARLRELFGTPGPDRILRLVPHGWGGQLVGDSVALRGRRYHPCQPLWQGMSVGWDGRVFVCCADLNGIHQVGDLTRDSLLDVWHGPALAHVRRLVAQNTRAELPLCASCDAVWWKNHPVFHDLKRAIWRVAGRPCRAVRIAHHEEVV